MNTLATLLFLLSTSSVGSNAISDPVPDLVETRPEGCIDSITITDCDDSRILIYCRDEDHRLHKVRKGFMSKPEYAANCR